MSDFRHSHLRRVAQHDKRMRRFDAMFTAFMIVAAIVSLAVTALLILVGVHFALKYW